MKNKETLKFQSEVKQLLDILVYSLYKHKEVFLRELISNSVDALNKIKFELLTSKSAQDKNEEINIQIFTDKDNKKLVVEDNGVGMTKGELINNIGTIARSGRLDFLKKATEAKDKKQLELIGKFGVGFYSSFMVAEKVHIITKSYKKQADAWLWKSDGSEEYVVEKTKKKKRGTRIELFLKDDAEEFLDKAKIKYIINKHSKFVPFPIYVDDEKLERKSAIWTQPKTKLKKKDYIEFFKYLTNFQEEPLTYLHLSSDAPFQFYALLYIPETSFEFLDISGQKSGVDLYSHKVLIDKSSGDIMPDYLNFIKGIVDSEDIPLNISRESVQNNAIIIKIKKYIIKKLLEHFNKLKENEYKIYKQIWDKFGRKFKEGAIKDFENRDQLSKLLLFHSSRDKEKLTDLKTYIKNMDHGQDEIYYISGDSIDAINRDPALEIFKKKDYEVLYLMDPIDEFVFQHLGEFEDKKFKMVESADIKIDDKEKKEEKSVYRKNVEEFIKYLKELYEKKIQDVKISKRLVDSPCILVSPKDSPSTRVEKVMKMINKDFQYSKKILEINPDNELIKSMVKLHNQDSNSETLKNLAFQLLDNQLLREGLVQDIDSVIDRIHKIMKGSV